MAHPAMSPHDAWLYAASWGSFISGGDPGACLYGFDEKFLVQSEEHRAACLAEMHKNKLWVEMYPSDYQPDELDQMAAFVEALKAAPVA